MNDAVARLLQHALGEVDAHHLDGPGVEREDEAGADAYLEHPLPGTELHRIESRPASWLKDFVEEEVVVAGDPGIEPLGPFGFHRPLLRRRHLSMERNGGLSMPSRPALPLSI